MLYIQPLNAKEIAELEKLTRKAVGRIAERAWYILLSNQGKSIPEICELFGRHPTCVRDWIKRYQAEGIAGIQDKARKGRPKKDKPLR
jgi:transposase